MPPPRPRIEPTPPARPGFLGIGGRTVKRRGVRVTIIREGAPADEAGIREGDILTSINGERILNWDQFYRRVKTLPAGMKVRIRYERRDEASGVSIDEEVTNLVRLQAAFQANARVISTVSKLLESIINLV